MTTLGDAADFVMGQAPPGAECNTDGIGTPFVKAGEFSDPAPVIREWTTTPLKLGTSKDVFICVVGATSGKINLGIDCAIGRSVAAVRPKNGKLDRRYLYYFLGTWTERLRSRSQGVAQGVITREMLSAIEIPLPPLLEQQRIADILDKADAIRRSRRDAICLSRDMLPAVFAEMFGPGGSKYKCDPLDDHLCFLTSGSRGWAEHYVPFGKRFIRSLDVQMNFIGSDDVAFVNPPPGTEADRTRVKDGDVLVTITGSRIGRVAFVPDGFGEAYVSQHVAIVRLNPTLRPRYCSMFLALPDGGQRQIAKAQYGQTKPGLSLTNIREFQIAIPPIHEQDRFLTIWDGCDRLVMQQSRGLDAAEHLFNSLVQRAFRGAI